MRTRLLHRVPTRLGYRYLSNLGSLPTIPLWIAGEAVTESSAGSITAKNSKTRKESCEVVVAGEKET